MGGILGNGGSKSKRLEARSHREWAIRGREKRVRTLHAGHANPAPAWLERIDSAERSGYPIQAQRNNVSRCTIRATSARVASDQYY